MKRTGFRFLRFTFSPLVRFLWPTKITGKENLILDSRAIYISNHLSAMDANIMAVKLFKKDFNVLVKEEAYQKSKTFLKTIGAIPVKREEADIKAVRRILQILNEDRQILIFPEGTRNSDPNTLLPFKNGCALFAIKTKSPIVPLLIRKKNKLFHKNQIIIGKPIYFKQYYDKNANEVKDEATEYLYNTLMEMRRQYSESGKCK